MEENKTEIPMPEEEEAILKGSAAKDYITQIRILTRIKEHCLEIKAMHLHSKGFHLANNNPYGGAYSEAMIDFARDMIDLLEGKEILTMREIREKIKKENEEMTKQSNNEDLGIV